MPFDFTMFRAVRVEVGASVVHLYIHTNLSLKKGNGANSKTTRKMERVSVDLIPNKRISFLFFTTPKICAYERNKRNKT